MKIPRVYKKLQAFLNDTIDECNVSRQQRINEARYYRDYLLKGTATNEYKVHFNKIYPFVDMMASTLFSPIDARFLIDYDYTDDPKSIDMALKAARIITRDIQKTKTDNTFGEGVFWSCVYGSMFLRDNWGHHGAESTLIFPSQMGVLKENTLDLARQEAFTIVHYITRGQFMRLISDHPDREQLIKDVVKAAASARKSDEMQNNIMNQLIISGINNAMTTNGSQNTKHGAFLFGSAQPAFGPEVLAEMIQLDETWIMDMESSDAGDYVTYLSVGEHIIEGRYKKRNLSGVKGETGITQISPHPMEGYFWSRSELANVIPLQDEFVGRMHAYNRIAKMRANPARVGIGMPGINEQRYKAANTPGGYMSDSTPGGKMESLAPEMPTEQQYMMDQIDAYFDEAGGFTQGMKGKGEAGVRAGDHADTLIRNGSARIRDKAINIERQYADVGDFRLKLMAAKQATNYKTENGDEFRLGDLPGDWRVTVDSHSSSPVFAEDNKQMALQLKKLGVIDASTTVRMLHPPMEDEIVDTIKRSEKQNAELQEKAAKQDPSFWSKLLTGKKK